LIGKGAGLLFADGTAKEITWTKKTRESEIVLTDKSSKDIELSRGKVWVSIVPIGVDVTY
jgi:hypothetical protein